MNKSNQQYCRTKNLMIEALTNLMNGQQFVKIFHHVALHLAYLIKVPKTVNLP